MQFQICCQGVRTTEEEADEKKGRKCNCKLGVSREEKKASPTQGHCAALKKNKKVGKACIFVEGRKELNQRSLNFILARCNIFLSWTL